MREVIAFPPLQMEVMLQQGSKNWILPKDPAPASPALEAPTHSPVSHELRGSSRGKASGQRSGSSSCPEGPTLPTSGEPSRPKPTHPLPIQWKGEEEKEGGTQEQPCSELRAPHKGKRQVGLLCQLPGGKRGGGGFPDSGRRGGGGRTDSSAATDHFQQSAPPGPSSGRWIQPKTCPRIAPQGKMNLLLFSLSP